MEVFSDSPPAVLIVDDVEANLFALEAVLEPLGVDVLRARSGAEALDVLLEDPFRIALVLLDVQMPVMDGFEVASHMRDDHQLASIPIMFLTAHDPGRTNAMRGYASGGFDYLSKPFDPLEFREKVRALLAMDAERRSQRLLYEQARAGADAALVLDVVGDGVALLDAAGVVRVWNPAAELITHLYADELLGRPAAVAIPWWRDLEPRIPVAVDGPASAKTLSVGRPVEGLWLSISGVDYGRGRAYAFRDASVAHRLERLEADFVATVSHELRTPLTSISGASETLTRDDIELGEETRQRLLEVISHESRRLATLVDDVLMTGRLGGADVEPELVPTDAVDVARHVLDAASLKAPDRVQVALVANEPLPRVVSDASMFHQVLTNLVDNAIKYSPGGGRVTIEFAPGVRTMRIAVRDEGIGIPEADIDEIFTKFFRVHGTVASAVSGTGLGLYIVRELVERMHGAIRVQSRVGQGTTFELELPLAESVLDAHAAATTPSQSTTPTPTS